MLADHDWTPELTAERLVEAFRLLPGRGIYSPAKGDFRDLAGRRLEGLAMIACAQNCLGRQSPARRMPRAMPSGGAARTRDRPAASDATAPDLGPGESDEGRYVGRIECSGRRG